MLQPQCNVKTTAWPADQYKLLKVQHEIGQVSKDANGNTVYTNLNEDGVYFRVRLSLALLTPLFCTTSPSIVYAVNVSHVVCFAVTRSKSSARRRRTMRTRRRESSRSSSTAAPNASTERSPAMLFANKSCSLPRKRTCAPALDPETRSTVPRLVTRTAAVIRHAMPRCRSSASLESGLLSVARRTAAPAPARAISSAAILVSGTAAGIRIATPRHLRTSASANGVLSVAISELSGRKASLAQKKDPARIEWLRKEAHRNTPMRREARHNTPKEAHVALCTRACSVAEGAWRELGLGSVAGWCGRARCAEPDGALRSRWGLGNGGRAGRDFANCNGFVR